MVLQERYSRLPTLFCFKARYYVELCRMQLVEGDIIQKEPFVE